MVTSDPSKDDVDMEPRQEDEKRCFELPAHIAERFYRKSSALRRSSTQSSRRSSFSSLHSHQSKLSCHGGPQSTHIAQHLRRASIIESRKARLADRAAHAEQVRLRAAAAKSAPRSSCQQDKLRAAQAAREKLLAEIAARCEEEVRRAKKIAEETKEKRAAEHARMCETLAEKWADAARRRSIYQHNRRPRTTSLAAVEEKKVDRAALRRLGQRAAATVIQRAWRLYYQRKLIAAFTSLDLNLDRTRSMSFEAVTQFVSHDQVLRATADVLRLLRLYEAGGDETGDKGAVRVFLSAYVILSHPMQAFSHGGNAPQEQDLISKGQALLEAFERQVQVRSRTTLLQSLSSESSDLSFLYDDYSSAFHAWKSQDLTVIIDVMINSFVNLDLILQATKEVRDGHVAEDYLEAVRTEQIKLLARLKKLAGPDEALSRVRTAVRKARRQRAREARKESARDVPRTQSADASSSTAQTVTELRQPAPPQSGPSETAPAGVLASCQLQQAMTVLPSNREISHEMQIQGSYSIEQQPWTDSRRTFLDSLRTSMRCSMQYGDVRAAASWTHAMAVLIREKILSLISPRHPLYDRFDGFLDAQLIEQQARNGMFSYGAFFETMATLIAKICSPGRDQAVREFTADTGGDVIDKLFTLLNIIDLMTLDHINFQFRMATAAVLEHGHHHEHDCFQRDLDERVHGLDSTRRWWRAARSTLNVPASLPPLGHMIYARALAGLVLSNTHLAYSDLPETMRLDWRRLRRLRARVCQVVTISSILLTTKIRLRRNREALWTNDAETLMGLDLAGTDCTRIVALVESSHLMPDNTREGLVNFVSRVLPPAAAAARNAALAERQHLLALQMGQAYSPSRSDSATGPNPTVQAGREEGAGSTHGSTSLTGQQGPLMQGTEPSHPSPASNSNSLSEGNGSSAHSDSDSSDVYTEQVSIYILKSLREHVQSRLTAVSTAEKVRVTTSAAEVLARIGMAEFLAEVSGIVDTLERVRRVDVRAHGTWYDVVAAEAEAEANAAPSRPAGETDSARTRAAAGPAAAMGGARRR